MDWLDLLAIQGTFKSLLQHYSSKASILHHSAFFTVQISQPHMNTGKTTALPRWKFVFKVMSIHFNVLCRFVIAFLPRSKSLSISWLQSLFTVILEPKERKSVTISIFSPSICHEVLGLDAMILFFFFFLYLILSKLFHSPPSSSSTGSAGVQPWWIQGIRSGDGIGEDQETTA